MAETTAVAEKKPQALSEYLITELEKRKESFPNDVNVYRFVENMISLANTNPDLKKYGAPQMLSVSRTACTLGVDFFNKEAYAVPYGSQLQFQLGYKGATKLCKKYSIRPIDDIQAYIIREGDEFSCEMVNGKTTFTYKPKSFNDGPIIGAFAVAMFTDGGCQVEQMNRKELDAARKQSKAQNSPAWSRFPEEMYRKVVIHRLAKHIDIEWPNPDMQIAWDGDVGINTGSKVAVKNPFETVSEPETSDENVIDTTFKED